jgi:hypothetical protein
VAAARSSSLVSIVRDPAGVTGRVPFGSFVALPAFCLLDSISSRGPLATWFGGIQVLDKTISTRYSISLSIFLFKVYGTKICSN